jgi:hypothetical protein
VREEFDIILRLTKFVVKALKGMFPYLLGNIIVYDKSFIDSSSLYKAHYDGSNIPLFFKFSDVRIFP